MIDDALGWKPAVRRRRDDGASESSSRQGRGAEVVRPTTNNIQRRGTAREQITPKEDSQPRASRPMTSSKRESENIRQTPQQVEPAPVQKSSSQHHKKAKLVHIQKETHGMNSLSRSSVRLAEEQKKKQAQKQDQMYKLKLILFLIVSIFVMFETMTPSRKVPYKAKRR